jgi:hypothetical protein
MIHEAVRLLKPLDLVRMEYAREQGHDGGAYRDRQKADQEQRYPILADKSLGRRLIQSPSGGGKRHRNTPREEWIFGRSGFVPAGVSETYG